MGGAGSFFLNSRGSSRRSENPTWILSTNIGVRVRKKDQKKNKKEKEAENNNMVGLCELVLVYIIMPQKVSTKNAFVSGLFTGSEIA